MKPKACERCKEMFTPVQSVRRFCSKSCANKARRKVKKEVSCPVCGEGYVKRNKEQKYCSPKCCYQGRRREAPSTKVCAYCGKVFTRRRANKGRMVTDWPIRKYCNRECNDRARKREIFTPEQVEFLQENCKKLGRTICAKRFGIAPRTLGSKIQQYVKENGPIEYILEVVSEVEEVDIMTDYSRAWVECNCILNRWRAQVYNGRVGLMGRKIETTYQL